jgi:hypothetical protein
MLREAHTTIISLCLLETGDGGPGTKYRWREEKIGTFPQVDIESQPAYARKTRRQNISRGCRRYDMSEIQLRSSRRICLVSVY